MLIFDYSKALDKTLIQAVLAEHWAEAASELEAIQIHWQNSVNARVGLLNLSYAGHAKTVWPKSFFVKQCQHQEHWLRASEYDYYTRDYLHLKDAPLPMCYGAALAESGDYLLILQDLSASHFDNKEHSPDKEHVKAVALEFARLHAFSILNNPPVTIAHQYQMQLQSYFEQIQAAAQNFLIWARDLPSLEIQRAQRLLQSLPARLVERSQNPIGLTVLHGDANPSNVLSPREPGGKTYLIDRQPFVWSLRHGPGVFDLAYMAVPYWPIQSRQKYEPLLLQTYWQALSDFGVQDYSWEACLQDYVLSVQQSLCVALSWGEHKKGFDAMRWLWQKQWARSQRAIESWDSENLF